MIRRTLHLLALLLLAGCASQKAAASAGTTPTLAVPTPSPSAAAPSPRPETPTPVPPTATETVTPQPLMTFGLLGRPVPPDSAPFPDRNYAYGSTANGEREPHHGVEFPAPYGTPVLAAADGRVLFAGSDESEARFSPWKNFYGNLIVLAHQHNGQVFYTLYAHLSRIDVQAGETVSRGTPIGLVGMSGAAIGPHLHFEVRLGGTTYSDTRNPVLWLEPAEPTRSGALQGKVITAEGQPVYTHLTVQLLDENGNLQRQYAVETYAPEQYPVPTDEENFALGDLQPGTYRVTLYAAGKLWERLVPVQPGQVSEIVFTLP